MQFKYKIPGGPHGYMPVQRWKPTTRSARHKLNKFIKEHEDLLHPEPESLAGAWVALSSHMLDGPTSVPRPLQSTDLASMET